MKTNKLNLRNLKVTSFVTSEEQGVSGGRVGGSVDKIDIPTIRTTTQPTPNTMCYVCGPDLDQF